jgi:putative hydrolase of the HAD superfamily
MPEIKAVIFDLGGVLLNIDYSLTEKAFIELGITHFPNLYNQHHSGALFAGLETGRVTPAAFISAVQAESAVPLTERQITRAWNAMLLDFPPERMQFLRELGRSYPLYLLSNTNALHLEAFSSILKGAGLPPLESFFRKAYYSHLMNARKPDLAAFKIVIEENDLDPATTLFIDDTPSNVQGAVRAGLQAVLLTPPRTVMDLF